MLFSRSFWNPLTQRQVGIVVTWLKDGLAGYNEDASIIYVDGSVPAWMLQLIISHELLESCLIEELRFHYSWAHVQATQLERRLCERLKINWEEYDGTVNYLLAQQAKRSPPSVNPPDLVVHT